MVEATVTGRTSPEYPVQARQKMNATCSTTVTERTRGAGKTDRENAATFAAKRANSSSVMAEHVTARKTGINAGTHAQNIKIMLQDWNSDAPTSEGFAAVAAFRAHQNSGE